MARFDLGDFHSAHILCVTDYEPTMEWIPDLENSWMECFRHKGHPERVLTILGHLERFLIGD